MNTQTPRPKVLLITTSPEALQVFFLAQSRFLIEHGFDVCAICASGPQLVSFERESGCKVYRVPMRRSVNMGADLRALLEIVSLMRQLKPKIVHTHTPKAGLLGMLAARFLGLPIRIHTFHGLRSETLTGSNRLVVSSMERVTAKLASSCLAVSHSLRELLIARKICQPQHVDVLGYGGCAGVDLRVFQRELHTHTIGPYLRRNLIPVGSQIVTYAGRIAKDKGIEILAQAWPHVNARFPEARLVISGPLDATDPISPETLAFLQREPGVHLDASFNNSVPLLLAATDVFVSPSFREGLGVTILEASAMQVPVVASRVTGLVDAVEDGVTGILVPAREATPLAEAICTLLDSRTKASGFGASGRRFVEQRFDRARIFEHLVQRYRSELHAVAGSTPRHPAAMTVGKRAFDITIALLLLIATSPVHLAAIGLIFLTMARPVFFFQERGGFRGRTFRVVKLRTMTPGGEVNHSDAARLTSLGRLLRKLSIDELPQLWNVLRGEMSLVGPRPLLVSYLTRYDAEQARRHDVVPGITGWAQIHGRNALSWDSKFEYDVWYVDHRSFALDLKILSLTLLHVLVPRGISASGSATATEFLGR